MTIQIRKRRMIKCQGSGLDPPNSHFRTLPNWGRVETGILWWGWTLNYFKTNVGPESKGWTVCDSILSLLCIYLPVRIFLTKTLKSNGTSWLRLKEWYRMHREVRLRDLKRTVKVVRGKCDVWCVRGESGERKTHAIMKRVIRKKKKRNEEGEGEENLLRLNCEEEPPENPLIEIVNAYTTGSYPYRTLTLGSILP